MQNPHSGGGDSWWKY